jgi:hypothetical protein
MRRPSIIVFLFLVVSIPVFSAQALSLAISPGVLQTSQAELLISVDNASISIRALRLHQSNDSVLGTHDVSADVHEGDWYRFHWTGNPPVSCPDTVELADGETELATLPELEESRRAISDRKFAFCWRQPPGSGTLTIEHPVAAPASYGGTFESEGAPLTAAGGTSSQLRELETTESVTGRETLDAPLHESSRCETTPEADCDSPDLEADSGANN